MPHIRFNDGACDSKGRFLAGTIYSKDQGIPGQLWRYDPADGSCVVVDEGPFTVRLLMYHRVITYREPVGLQWPGLEPG
jgi:SMP-30/Gluconolactonase/LRE-like region